MADYFSLTIGQSVRAASGVWYRNLQLLGSGGNAATFLVEATSGPNKGLLFAAKVFRRLSKPERRAGFLQEIAFLKSCDHPAIMRVFDDGEVYEEYPFVVAEYLPTTLHQVIRAKVARMVEKVSYAVQLLSGLSYLASLNEPVIHRDIKPANIFIKGHSCVLGDFGLMKLEKARDPGDREEFKQSVGVGMPFRYRTPDLVDYLSRGVSPSTKSDVYQLGLVLGELFTGKNPQRAADDFLEPVVLDVLGPIPGAAGAGIANLISRMLAPDPAQRSAASTFLDPWQGVFLDAVKRSHALEGRVF